ncbi:flavodoxin family protein [Candidatus Methanoperedens nitratireducens]|uniref:flavodoxin family protein n=1 Tax=Candidatus Methanoperedens nitratireducens TaxID=1392998 RepID=UPI0012FEB159
MKVLFINGSPRKSGVTATILSAICDNISSDHTIEWFDVYDLKIKPCYGCLKSTKN